MVHRRALEQDRRDLLTRMLTDGTKAFIAQLAGSAPADEALWEEALTHGSTGERRNYERLEFLGDRVLGLAVAEWLYENPEANEGMLSQRLNALVSGSNCAAIGRAVGLGEHLRLGKQARDDGAHDSDNILGDVMEALIGACFVEWGYDAAHAMVRRTWAESFGGHAGTAKHPKSALQEWAAGNRRRMPEYRIVDRSGPDHAARFTIAVTIPGIGEVEASGSSKQDAETSAAAEFLRKFG